MKFSEHENLTFENENSNNNTNNFYNNNKDYNNKDYNNSLINDNNNSHIKDHNKDYNTPYNTPYNNSHITSLNISHSNSPKLLTQDLEVKNRNKRMMGVLMGTLSKFKSEEVDKSEANLKRILLEQRLTQKLLQAKEQLNTNTNTNIDCNFYDTEGITLKNSNPKAQEFSLNVLNDLKILKSETEDSCSKFQRTQTLPVIFFKRAAL